MGSAVVATVTHPSVAIMSHAGTLGRPGARQVASRLIILKHVVGHIIVNPPPDLLGPLYQTWSEQERKTFDTKIQEACERFWAPIHQSELWSETSPTERSLAATTPLSLTQQQRVDGTWRIEAVQVLMWALGLLPQLPAYGINASFDLLKALPSQGVPEFLDSAKLRKDGEITQERDQAELWHWRSRTRQLIESGRPLNPDPQMKATGMRTFDDIVRATARFAREQGRVPVINEDFAVNGKAYRDLSPDEWSQVRSVTVERHFALNWLCGLAPGNRWDDTPTET